MRVVMVLFVLRYLVLINAAARRDFISDMANETASVSDMISKF